MPPSRSVDAHRKPPPTTGGPSSAAVASRQGPPTWLTPRRVFTAAALALAFAVNLVWVAIIAGSFGVAADWDLVAEAGERMLRGDNPYLAGDVEGAYRYSPLYALIGGITEPLGPWPWRIASAASLLLLPRRLALIAAVSFPFWFDLRAGNVTTVMAVLAVLSVQGRGWAQAGYLAIAVLIPRPLMVPVVLWIVWRRRAWWPWLIAAAVLYAAATWATGWLDEWFAVLGSVSAGLEGKTFLGWQRWLGEWWWAVAVPLAAMLMWWGRLGLASIAISPHIVPYYWLFLLLEVPPNPAETRRSPVGGASP